MQQYFICFKVQSARKIICDDEMCYTIEAEGQHDVKQNL